MVTIIIASLYRNPSQHNRYKLQQQQQQHSFSFHLNNNNNKQQFKISTTNDPADFYFRNLLRYVRSGNLDNYFEKLEFPILKQYPIICSKLTVSAATTPNSLLSSNSTNNNSASTNETNNVKTMPSVSLTSNCINGLPSMSPTSSRSWSM